MHRRDRLAGAVRALRSVTEAFPFGLAPLLILTVALVAAVYLLFHPVDGAPATLRLWTFANFHAEAYESVRPAFEAKHPGTTIDIQVVHGDAVTRRLRAAFWADLDVPDLVEVEISRAGTFFRGPVDGVGFIDLTPHLLRSGLMDRIVKTRLAPYTNRGRIFGLPHDVHPVMLAYRRDLLEQLGIDPDELRTWDDFVRVGRRVTVPGECFMIRLSDVSAGAFEILLFQRGGGYFDADGKLTMDSEIALETVKWYVPLVAGPGQIGAEVGAAGQSAFAQAMEEGYFLTFLCADWATRSMERDVPRLAGKMALMPLPAFEPGGRRTSTNGGTMIGITKKCRDQELAWRLAQHLYLDTEDLGRRFRETNILPPIKDAWSHPALDEPHPYWSGQPVGRMFADLGDDVPPQYSSPFIRVTKQKMGQVITNCAIYYKKNGVRGFADFAQRRLERAANDVRRQMKRNPF